MECISHVRMQKKQVEECRIYSNLRHYYHYRVNKECSEFYTCNRSIFNVVIFYFDGAKVILLCFPFFSEPESVAGAVILVVLYFHFSTAPPALDCI